MSYIHNKRYYAFDLGDVLVEFDHQVFFEKLGKFQWIYSHLIDGPFHRQYEIGLISFAEICRDLFDRNNKFYNESDINEIKYAWNESISPNEEMISFYEKLVNKVNNKDNCYFALLSNIGEEHANLILDKSPILKKNSIHHFSYQVGARKPSKLYYQSFLISNKKFDLEDSVYLDDRKDNLETAEKLGFNCLYFSISKMKKLKYSDKLFLLDLLEAYQFKEKQISFEKLKKEFSKYIY